VRLSLLSAHGVIPGHLFYNIDIFAPEQVVVCEEKERLAREYAAAAKALSKAAGNLRGVRGDAFTEALQACAAARAECAMAWGVLLRHKEEHGC
jgi:hypothetical protein